MLKEMPSIILTEEQLSSYRTVNILHEESKIYIAKKEVIKIFNDSDLCEERQSVVDILYNYQIKGFCNPTAKVYNDLNQFIGYVMTYLRGYKNIISDKLSVEQKIKIAKTLINIFKEASKLNVVYNDFNVNNILTNGVDVQYIDTDSVILTSDYIQEDLDYLINYCCKSLARIILSLIIEIDIDRLCFKNKTEDIIELLESLKDPYLLDIVAKIYTKDLTKTDEFYVDKQLDHMDIEKVIALSKKVNIVKGKIIC